MLCSTPESNSTTVDDATTSIAESVGKMSLSPIVLPEPDNISAPTIDDSQPLSPFFQLPFEIRSEILFYMVCARATEPEPWMQLELPLTKEDERGLLGRAFGYDLIELEPNLIPGSKYLGIDEPSLSQPWGKKRMALLFPICRQWYREIQIAFYPRVRFYLFYNWFIQEWKPHALSFLPKQVLPLIRSLHLTVQEKFTALAFDNQAAHFIQAYQDIATVLPSLTTIRLSFQYKRSNGPQPVPTPEALARAREIVLAMASPFRHIRDFAFIARGNDEAKPDSYDYDYPEAHFYRLVLDIAMNDNGVKKSKDDIQHLYYPVLW